ncbi:MAG: hypothetical protein OXK74_02220 [Gemmatimonadota bacterium]|nr:hypothetical protein [Gemmatimonadota bacterium]
MTPIDIHPPEDFGLDISVRQVAPDDERHKRLRSVLSVPTTRHLWTPEDAITFTPPLSDLVYGDGRALLAITTTHDRPAFWLVRIDSRWDIGTPSFPAENAPYVGEYVDLIVANLESEFGNGTPGYYDCQEEEERDPYPAINANDGQSWSWHSWPVEAGPVEPHSYWPHTTIATQ